MSDTRLWHQNYQDGVPPDVSWPDGPLDGLLRRSADKYPDAPALVFFDRTLTYRQVDAIVDQLAAGLQDKHRTERGLFPIHFRIGINAGSMLAGNMGSKEKMEYTVVGDTVNLASRFCSMADEGEIVISSDFYEQENIRNRIKAREHIPMQLRGVEGIVETFLLEGLADEYIQELEAQLRNVQGLVPDKF